MAAKKLFDYNIFLAVILNLLMAIRSLSLDCSVRNDSNAVSPVTILCTLHRRDIMKNKYMNHVTKKYTCLACALCFLG